LNRFAVSAEDLSEAAAQNTPPRGSVLDRAQLVRGLMQHLDAYQINVMV
jgi:hypothetical protein